MSASIGGKNRTDFDLELTPMMGLMITLIPILLMSTAFIQVRVIETDIPQVVQEAIQNDKESPSAWVDVKIMKNYQLMVLYEENQKINTQTIPALNDQNADLAKLTEKLSEIKEKFPKTFKIEIHPEPGVIYKDIVKVMDASRKSQGRQFPIFNAKGEKVSESDLMFPNVVFANVFGGER